MQLLKKSLQVVLAGMLLVGALAVPAAAEKDTVEGTGDITKLFANNTQKAVIAKVFGMKGPCSARMLNIEIWSGKKKGYKIQAGCYGEDWIYILLYSPDRSDPQTFKPVKCKGLKLTYKGGVYKAKAPHKCLPKAGKRVRVYAEGFSGDPNGGQAGPTKPLKRG